MSRSDRTASRDGHTRRSEILETAAAVFARKGVAGATVRDIADEAHILSGSLYHHFESKDQMVEEILRYGFDELVRGYALAVDGATTAAGALRGVLWAGVGFMMRNPVVGTIIRNDSRPLERIERFAFITDYKRELYRIVTAVLERGIASGELHDDIDMEVAYYVISDAVLGTVRYPSMGERTPEEVAERISTLLVRSFVR